MFPPEIWRMIWRKIDPVALTLLKCVNKTWHDEIEEILTKHTQWSQLSEQMPEMFRYAVIKKNIEEKVNWDEIPLSIHRQIYQSWKIYRRDVTYPRPVQHGKINDLLKFSDTERITSLFINSCSGETLIYGTNEGLIYFTYLHDLKKPFFIADHGQTPITQIEMLNHSEYCFPHLRCEKSYDFPVSVGANGYVKYWNQLKRHEIKSWECPGTLVSSGNDNGIVTLYNGFRTVYCFDKYKNIAGIWHMQILPPDTTEKVVAFCERHKILTYDEQKNVTKIYSVLDAGNPNFIIKLDSTHVFPHNCASSVLKKFREIDVDLTACLTDNYMLLSFDEGEWISYDMYNRLGGNVRSIVVDETSLYLLMGLDNGDVYIFKCGDLNVWRDFDFTPLNGTKINFDSEPIVHLATYSMNIIAATERNIHVQKFEFELYNRVEINDDNGHHRDVHE